MPSFADSIFLFVLALLLFGPKKLPVLARELGKWVGEFRRASNDFKMQMEDELRAVEQADRQKQIAAMEAAAPVPPALGESDEPEHPHLRRPALPQTPPPPLSEPTLVTEPARGTAGEETDSATSVISLSVPPEKAGEEILDGVRSVPIATSGDLHMMPPATGLPTPRRRTTEPQNFSSSPAEPSSSEASGVSPAADPLGGLLRSLPEGMPAPDTFTLPAQEATTHGD